MAADQAVALQGFTAAALLRVVFDRLFQHPYRTPDLVSCLLPFKYFLKFYLKDYLFREMHFGNLNGFTPIWKKKKGQNFPCNSSTKSY